MGAISPLLAVRDMKAAIRFYAEKLGFKLKMAFPSAENPEYADLDKDGMVVMLMPAAAHGISAGDKFGTGVYLYMHIDGDIDKYYQELKARGVRIAVDIKDEPYGVRDFTVEDSDGYKLTFNQTKAAKQCLSCGMPMVQPEDFGGGTDNPHCIYCSKPDGSLKSREEVFEGMVSFIMMSEKADRKTAEAAARERMAGLPAWSDNA